jgi:hypothetical protein
VPARGHRARRAPSQFQTSLVLPPATSPAGSSSGHVIYTGGRTRSSRELAAAGPATEALATASKGSRRDSIRRGQTIISRLEGHPELADMCSVVTSRSGTERRTESALCANRRAPAPSEFSPSVRANFLSGCLPQVTRWPTAGPRNPVITRPDPVRQTSAHSLPQ